MSEWTKYWQRIDNTPGSLERLTPAQLAEVRQMVKAAFHAGHGMYQQRIRELEEEIENIREIHGRKVVELVGEIDALSERIRELEKENDRLRQDRADALNVKSRDGLLSSEWIARTGRAERRYNALLERLERLPRTTTSMVLEDEWRATVTVVRESDLQAAIKEARDDVKNPPARDRGQGDVAD